MGLLDNPAWGRAVGGKLEMETSTGGKESNEESCTGKPVSGLISAGVFTDPVDWGINVAVGMASVGFGFFVVSMTEVIDWVAACSVERVVAGRLQPIKEVIRITEKQENNFFIIYSFSYYTSLF